MQACETILYSILDLMTVEMVKKVIKLCINVELDDYDAGDILSNLKMEIEREYFCCPSSRDE